ncbi:hypothetical protein BCR44DRAFT_1482377 [Catenaria anguillulae PL171]|uniref:RanBD1 domain-containing protein n=1 Tax=Catenaria anguillulae PL171 TaxID=765915 RepID=A0A1Y2I165_9FUNG|nr:hypothetical protein BCR44DRAFT_1482377 [Catenaria anguillulae PL171]
MPKRKNDQDHHRSDRDRDGDGNDSSEGDDNQALAPVATAPSASQQHRRKFVRRGTSGATSSNGTAASGPAGPAAPTPLASGFASAPAFAFGTSVSNVPSFHMAMGSAPASFSTGISSGFGASSSTAQASAFEFGGPKPSGAAGNTFQTSADIIKESLGKSPSASGPPKPSPNPAAFNFATSTSSNAPSSGDSRTPPPSTVSTGNSTDDQHSKMRKLNEDLYEHVSSVCGNDPCADLTIVYQKYIEYAKEIKGGSGTPSAAAKPPSPPAKPAPAPAPKATVPSPPPPPPPAFGAALVAATLPKPKSPTKSSSSTSPPAIPSAPAQGFAFGGKPVAAASNNSAPSAPFVFGAPTSSAAPSATTAATTTPMFSFGSTPATNSATSMSTSAAAPKPFTFGSASSSSSGTTSSFPAFGTNPSTAAPAPGAFTFGGASSFPAFGSTPTGTATSTGDATTAGDVQGGPEDDDDAPPPAPTGPAAVESSALLDGESMYFEHKFRVRVCQPDQDPAKTRPSEWPVKGVGTVSLIRNEASPGKHRLFIRTGTTVDGVVANTLLSVVTAMAVKVGKKSHARVAVFGADPDKYKGKPMMLFLSVDEDGGSGEKAIEFVDKVKECKEQSQ